VTITADGNNTITGGVQDFNDGFGLTSPQPAGDTILAAGSSLVFSSDGSGNAVLTLATSNTNLGNAGVETFALSFANANHALISQFDGTATSAGSYDLQTLPSAPINTASFSFTSTGADVDGDPIAEGGVFSLDGSGNVTGQVDINDAGTVTAPGGQPIPEGTILPASDTFGRGTVTGNLDGITTVNFYIVNSEVIRLIDVDTTDTAVGSAYGQGTAAGSFSPASIGQSAFYISGIDGFYNGAGQFFTTVDGDDAKPRSNKRPARPQGELPVCTGSPCAFEGTADVNESVFGGDVSTDAAFDGTYTLAGNGYGSFTFVDPPAETDVALFGIYAVDPTLNILDPNNSATGLTGGALIAELDTNLVGTGVLIPQVALPVVTDIAADVVFGAQGNGDVDGTVDEFDLLGASTVDAGVFSGEGFIDDPAAILIGSAIVDDNSTFSATFADDGAGIGRYLSGPGGFVATDSADDVIDFTVTAYDANGDQLFWVETDEDFTWGGSIQASTFEVPDAKKAQAKPRTKSK
jgi:hypothetical protein